PRRAGVSAFGVSGTNAHVILEEAPQETGTTVPAPAATPAVDLPVVPWVVSARSKEALTAQLTRLANGVAGPEPVDVGLSLAETRSGVEHRAVVLGGDMPELLSGLEARAAGQPAARTVSGVKRTGPTALVFS